MPRHPHKPGAQAHASVSQSLHRNAQSPSEKQPLPYRSQPRTQPNRPPSSRPVDPKLIARYRTPALLLVGASVLAISFKVAFTITAYNRDAEHYATKTVPADVSDRYKNVAAAEAYDADVATMERLMGITGLRKKLLAKARGNVLEASVGTGRNAAHYPLTGGDIKSVTMVDTSPEMLRIARLKWAETNPWFIHALFRIQSAADPVPCPAEEGFDTVVQTMGVCSTAEPEAALRNLGQMCRQDGEGRILLLEHGRGHYAWLNRWIDKIAPAHADREGCWFNKDVGEIVRNSGLEIVEQKRYHFGTTWWFELKPPKRKEGEKMNATGGVPATDRPWWASLWK